VQRRPDTELRPRKSVQQVYTMKAVMLSGQCDVITQKSRLKYEIRYNMLSILQHCA